METINNKKPIQAIIIAWPTGIMSDEEIIEKYGLKEMGDRVSIEHETDKKMLKGKG